MFSAQCEIIIEAEDKLSRQRFLFDIADWLKVGLRSYFPETRKTTRHKYHMAYRAGYLYWNKRESIKYEKVPLTEDIINQALNKFKDMITWKPSP